MLVVVMVVLVVVVWWWWSPELGPGWDAAAVPGRVCHITPPLWRWDGGTASQLEPQSVS